LFIYSLHHLKEQSYSFTINDFSDTIKLLAQVDISSQGQKALKNLKIAVENKIATLVLRNNTDYYDCFLMNKILSDIEKYQQMNFSDN
jgi:hypothetical protein